MTMVTNKKIFYECLTHFDLILVVIAFFMALGFLMGLITITFALPIDFYKSLWNSESG